MPLVPPQSVALARTAARIPQADGWSFEPKYDGWRCLIFVAAGGVTLQARGGRIISDRLPDLVDAAEALPAGTVLDGEALVFRAGRIDFGAMQSRALAHPRRARVLAAETPASFAAFDLLQDEDGRDLRGEPYRVRRERLLAVVDPLGPPIQPTPATEDAELAAHWFETLPEIGVEGIVAKRADAPYHAGVRDWLKIKHPSARP